VKHYCLQSTNSLILFGIRKNELSDQWKESVIVPIHKKGDKTDCNNYRGISLYQLHTKFYQMSSQG
jgi:hypothetical protein